MRRGYLFIKRCSGYELKKEKPNSFEDYFNRSEMVYEEDGKEKTFHVLYLRYFEEKLNELTPFQENPIFTINEKAIELKDAVALACLISNPQYRQRKRVYINKESQFSSCFEGASKEKLLEIFQQLNEN